MAFVPEDKRAWQASEVMSELEKIAKETNLLTGTPAEAFQPIQEETWEDEDIEEPKAPELDNVEPKAFAADVALVEAIEKMAQDIAEARRTKIAYRIERALCAIKDIAGGK